MVKNLRLPFRKKFSQKGSKPKSPEIQLNSESVAQNTNIFQSEEELYSKVENYLSQSSGSNSSFSDLGLSSNSSLDILSGYEFKESNKQKKAKRRLSELGNKHIAQLIAYLHSDKPLVKSKLDFDGQDFQLLQSYETAVDLDKFFKEKKPLAKTKLWKTPIVFSKRDNRKATDNSLNGLHQVNRFGEGISDGCSVSLNLKSKGKDFGDVFQRSLEWNDIIEEADQVLFEYENLGKKSTRRTRRGSLLQPRIIFLSPHPEAAYERVLQSANCLPLRTWTSELFLCSKESAQLLDSETKRNLQWNTSVEDFRHLLSPELSHFGNDVYSMMIEAKRRLSLCPPQAEATPLPFRRNSYRDGEVWQPIDPNKHQKKDYVKKLGVIRQNSGKVSEEKQSSSKFQSTNSLLSVPNEMEGIHITSFHIICKFCSIVFNEILFLRKTVRQKVKRKQ